MGSVFPAFKNQKYSRILESPCIAGRRYLFKTPQGSSHLHTRSAPAELLGQRREAPPASPEATPEMPPGPRHPTRLRRASLPSPQSASTPSCCSSEVVCVSCFASAVTTSLRQGRRQRGDLCCPSSLTFPLAALLRSLQGSVGV